MDPFNNRDNDEDIFAIVRQSEVDGAEDIGAEDIGAEDGSQFLNDSGQGMEVEDEAQTSIECDATQKLVDIRRLARYINTSRKRAIAAGASLAN